MIDLRKDGRLHELSIDKRCHHRQDRLIRIHDRAFRQGIDIALEMEIRQIREELLGEDPLLAEILHIIL